MWPCDLDLWSWRSWRLWPTRVVVLHQRVVHFYKFYSHCRNFHLIICTRLFIELGLRVFVHTWSTTQYTWHTRVSNCQAMLPNKLYTRITIFATAWEKRRVYWTAPIRADEYKTSAFSSWTHSSSSLSDSLESKVVLWRWENPTWRHNDVILWVSK